MILKLTVSVMFTI